MRIIETKVYKYAELSEEAKERARDWLRNAQAGDNYFSECVTEDFLETLKALGFDVDAKRGLQWSGFSSQGDGAAFAGTWYASDFAPGKLLANRPEVYLTGNGELAKSAENAELHRIAGVLKGLKKEGLTSATVSVSHRSHFMELSEAYMHDAETDDDTHAPEEQRDAFIEAARDLAHGFYKALEAEYEYHNSDEQIAESIEANEYEFTEEGTIA